MEAAQQQKRPSAISVKTLSSYGGRDEDSDEPRSAAGGDTDDSDSERVKAGEGGDESPRTANNSSFHETFAKFRQSYLSSATATAPKKVYYLFIVFCSVALQAIFEVCVPGSRLDSF